jgi:hypothetical protein
MLDLATTPRGVLMIIFAVLMVGALSVGLGLAGFHSAFACFFRALARREAPTQNPRSRVNPILLACN